MDQTLDELAKKIIARFKGTPAPRRLLVGIAGIPGSGKSTLAGPLTLRINSLLGEPADARDVDRAAGGADLVRRDETAICVGLDGWHYTRQQLGSFPDPVLARARRGAAWTFDAPSYASFVRSLRADPPLPAIPFPTFDHALKDPCHDGSTPILPSHRIVIIEGLYAFIDDPATPAWAEAAAPLDERIWVETPVEVARERVAKRNFASGIEPTLEATYKRVDENDLPNGEWIVDHRLEPTEIIHST